MKIITDEKRKLNDSIWRGAQTVTARTGENLGCFCDICRRKVPSYWCKVYHTIDSGCIFTRAVRRDALLITDHMYVCAECRHMISEKWIGCNCSHLKQDRRKEIICPLKK